jgi:hypothetical protein
MNGELLQGLNYLCNRGLGISVKNFRPAVPNTLVTLTLLTLLVTFRLKPLVSGI